MKRKSKVRLRAAKRPDPMGPSPMLRLEQESRREAMLIGCIGGLAFVAWAVIEWMRS